MDTTLSQRVLPGLESRLDSTIVIVSNSMFDTDCTIRLYLIAPDLAELDELRADLCARLKKSLTDVDPNWVHDVTIEYHFETGEPEIIVEINDVSLLGNRSFDRILASAETFVTPFAAKHQRSVYVLKDDQCLVPLTFDQPVTSTALLSRTELPAVVRATSTQLRFCSWFDRLDFFHGPTIAGRGVVSLGRNAFSNPKIEPSEYFSNLFIAYGLM